MPEEDNATKIAWGHTCFGAVSMRGSKEHKAEKIRQTGKNFTGLSCLYVIGLTETKEVQRCTERTSGRTRDMHSCQTHRDWNSADFFIGWARGSWDPGTSIMQLCYRVTKTSVTLSKRLIEFAAIRASVLCANLQHDKLISRCLDHRLESSGNLSELLSIVRALHTLVYTHLLCPKRTKRWTQADLQELVDSPGSTGYRQMAMYKMML